MLGSRRRRPGVIGGKEKIYDAGAAAALIPGVKTLSIPGGSHDLMFSQPAQVNAALKEFLAD